MHYHEFLIQFVDLELDSLNFLSALVYNHYRLSIIN